ncbi:MAG: ParB/RepB/Spo0J family partition protein [Janthinobacterium lividum]
MHANQHGSPETKRRALGKGLDSLLPPKPAAIPAPVAEIQANASEGRPLDLDVTLIDRNPYQTRSNFDEAKLAELAASITASGVVQPLVVRISKEGRYTLITGERRWLASKLAGKMTVPVIVRDVSDLQTMEMTVVENLQRADLNPMEQARAFERLSREFHLTQEQMAERTGKDRASVSNFMRLLRLPDDVQQMVESGELSFGHARALLALPTPEMIGAAAQKVMSLGLSVRATESLVQGLLNPEGRAAAAKPVKAVDPNVRETQQHLQRSLGLKVTIEDKRGKGRVIIEYNGVDDFDSILNALGKGA